jgi:hypothetical protein
MEEESEETIKSTMKWSAMVHVSVVILLMITSFIIQKYFTPEKMDSVVVTIKPPDPAKLEELMPPKKPVQTVGVSDKKIQPVDIKPGQKFSNRTTKPKHIAPQKVTRYKNIPIQKNVPANRIGNGVGGMGVLGAIGASNRRNGNPMSLNLNGTGNGEGGRGKGGRGYGGFGHGGGGLGEGLTGGASGALPGRGLIASSPGTGSQAVGAGGFGSSGTGGGRAGVGGAISFRGKSGGFTVPLEEEALVEGGLDRDQIAAVVQRNMGQIIYCYESGLQTKPTLKGRLTARWVINGHGTVNMSKVAHSSVGDGRVESCIVSKIRGWKFPKPVGGVNVDVTYPFELRRVSQM